jgi:hypothetical protein
MSLIFITKSFCCFARDVFYFVPKFVLMDVRVECLRITDWHVFGAKALKDFLGFLPLLLPCQDALHMPHRR